jgi:radical SAM protein with 4Fe4S-binding SPASM domain
MAFSLDGLERAHDHIRRKGSFAKVLQSIAYSRAEGIRVAVVTHITHHNLHDLEEMHELLRSHQVTNWQLQQGVPVGNLSEDRQSVLSPQDILELIPRLAAMKQREPPRVFIADNIGYYGEHEKLLRTRGKARIPFWLGCRAGLEVLGIESNGNIKGCLSLPSERNERYDFLEGNTRQRSLIEIWNDPDAFAYNRKFTVEQLNGVCRNCDFGEICRGGCSVTSIGHFGQPHHFPNCYHAAQQGWYDDTVQAPTSAELEQEG